MKYYGLSKAAEYLHVSPFTMRNYALNGQIPYTLTPGGHKRFSKQDLDTFGNKDTTLTNKKYAYYARSSQGNKTAKENQLKKLTETFGEPVKTYQDNGSGLSDGRARLWAMYRDAKKGDFNTIAVVHKDRLTRFGLQYVEAMFAEIGVEIVSIRDKTDPSPEDELMQDFMSLIASFSGKFYRLRSNDNKRKLLKTALAKVDKNES